MFLLVDGRETSSAHKRNVFFVRGHLGEGGVNVHVSSKANFVSVVVRSCFVVSVGVFVQSTTVYRSVAYDRYYVSTL